MSPATIGTPSTTYSGSLLAEIDAMPRTRTLMPLPGLPAFWITFTPGALPCSAPSMLAIGWLAIWSEFTEDTAVLSSPRTLLP